MISPTSAIRYSVLPQRGATPKDQPPVEVNAYIPPAEIQIRTSNPELKVDFDRVSEEIGYLKLDGQLKEIISIAQREINETIEEEVRAGLRARNIHKNKGNVFGQAAYEKFLNDRKTQIRMDAVPKFGVKIDVRIYPPDIEVDTNIKAGTNQL
jgi:hypothetical protein